MKNILGLLLCILAFVSNAANVSFKSFDPNYFSTNSLNIQVRAPLSAITNAGTAAYSNASAFALAGSIQTNWPVSSITNAGTAAYSNATAFALAQSGMIMTNNNVNSFVIFTNNQVSLSVNSSGIFMLTNYAAAGVGFSWSTNGTTRVFATGATPFTVGSGLSQIGGPTTRLYDILSFSTMLSLANSSGIAFEGSATITGDAGSSGLARDASGGVKAVRVNAGSIGALTNMVFAFASMPTNYVASNFTPISGMVSIVASNGILYKVTQLSTNLLSALTP